MDRPPNFHHRSAMETFVNKRSSLLPWLSRWVPPILIMAIIFGFSSVPGAEMDNLTVRIDQISSQIQTSIPTQKANTQVPKKIVSSLQPNHPIVTVTKSATKASQPPRATVRPTSTSAPVPVSPVVNYFETYFDRFKYGHVFWYACLGLAFRRAFSQSMDWHTAALAAVLACAAYGALDEFHQWYVPGRDAMVMDACLDTAAAAVILQIQSLLFRKKSQPIQEI
jgi:hypothetical protein